MVAPTLDRVGAQVGNVDPLQGVCRRCFENYLWSLASLEGFDPSARANTPAVSGPEPWKAVLGSRGAQVVAMLTREGEEIVRDDDAYGVKSCVAWVNLATAIARKAGHGFGATKFELAAEYVLSHW